jgi:hypothetical protein
MVRDYATSRLIQAWPHLDAPPVAAAAATAAEGMCRACSEEPACRRCSVCASPSALRSSSKQQRRQHNTANSSCDGGGDLCFSCYVERHAGSAAMQSHSFTVIGAAAADAASTLMCGSCGSEATRHCHGFTLPPQALPVLESLAAAAREPFLSQALQQGDSPQPVTRQQFTAVLREQCGLHFSAPRIEALFTRCSEAPRQQQQQQQQQQVTRQQQLTRPPALFWAAAARAVQSACGDCDGTLCSACWQRLHARGARSEHTWTGFAAGSEPCGQCCRTAAEKRCDVCGDSLCSGCFELLHAHGKRRQHTWSLLLESSSDSYSNSSSRCQQCIRRLAQTDCKYCGGGMCDSCAAFKHLAQCAVKALAAQHQQDTQQQQQQQQQQRPEQHDHHSSSYAVHSGVSELPLECCVCGKPPDTQCLECGTVYCSSGTSSSSSTKRVIGMPSVVTAGCFAADHARGTRVTHVKHPYSVAAVVAARAAVSKQQQQQQQQPGSTAMRRARRHDQQVEDDDAELAAAEAAALRKRERDARLLREAKSELLAKRSGGAKGSTLGQLGLHLKLKLPAIKLAMIASSKGHQRQQQQQQRRIKADM